ncbi:Hsp20/alpha crystallin family protein [Halovivax limisalsi]|uniref:Hsp20/alpha crystallin family protein n=1 Tax=Halovivax limisalsi TaxID=1453760 RepID=UPI001FFD46C3|nr:Hsp20/alpha crystallin family protein [Halovivax limisalsi]
MSTVSPAQRDRPTQYYYDSATDRVDVVLDVSPAHREDLTVLVGEERLEVHIDADEGVDERAFRTPTADWTFGEDHEAVYNNGVLTVSVETSDATADGGEIIDGDD